MLMLDIIFRLVLAIIISGIIGFEREYKNRPAGARTHILVCIGATIIALIQQTITLNSLALVTQYPDVMQAITIDQSRLIAQVVSGIGFLGAGTIIVTKRSIQGLTTAATLWTVACLGIAIGLGYYQIVILGAIATLIALTLLKKIISIPTLKKIEVRFVHREETKEFLTNYLNENKVIIRDVEFSVDFQGDTRIYNNIYTIELPSNLTYTDIIEDVSTHKNVRNIKIINV